MRETHDTPETRETVTRARHVCPVCKHPVVSRIKRHKSLGVYVPIWRPGPCRNPDCSAYVPEDDGERKKSEPRS